MKLFSTTITDAELYPNQDPEVVRLQAEVQEVMSQAIPAAAAAARLWNQDNRGGSNPPADADYWPAKRIANETNQALERATAALALALDEATQRARTAWDEKIREDLRHDANDIQTFISLLEKYEGYVDEASAAGVPHVINVAQIFLTSKEVTGRFDYAQGQLGVK